MNLYMDDIDIRDLEFSLEKIPNISECLFTSFTDDYINYIYIVLAIVIILVFIFLTYKFCGNREKKVTFKDKLDDCYGDICPY